MTFQHPEFDRVIAEVRESISKAFYGIEADDRLFVLRDLLMAQVNVCALHYQLMQIDKDVRLMLSDATFSNVMDRHLDLARFFRSLPKSGASPHYELESIVPLYAFISHHFADSRPDDDPS